MNSKKWSFCVLTLYAGLLIIIGGSVMVSDPFFHYHAPIKNTSYELDNEQYMNDGITKHFEYNAIITGTSTSINFKTKEVDELFDVNTIRVSYSGEGFKKVNDNINVVIKFTPDLKLIIRGIDTMWFISGEDWLGFDEYPEYLYDDNIWNDVYYLYNKEVLFHEVIPQIVRTAQGIPAAQFDKDNYESGNDNRKEFVLKNYKRPERENIIPDDSETREIFHMMDRNLQVNVINTIDENPDITFYLFFPPYSICWWDSLNQYGEAVLLRRIAMEQYAIEKLLPYDNVRLFSFFNNYNLICDLNNYIDEVHYVGNVASDVLYWMKQGKYELTEENYKEYISEITAFYSNYDYDIIFE